ncbi:MAG: cytochrome C oxidase Cbb3 [Gammaproteobacteria bacterium]|nr:MAG: cytochrome C oxidase Cbb3 [Gammaproteobacteria bacterium]
MYRSSYLLLLLALFCGACQMSVNRTAVTSEGETEAAEETPIPGMVGTELGIGLFQTHCAACHGNPNGPENATDPAIIRQMPPERIYAALTGGVMQIQAQQLNDRQKQTLAEFMSGRPLGSEASGDANAMQNHCQDNPPLAPATIGQWNGWGAGIDNARYQPAAAAGLAAADIPRLKLRWAFGFPGGISTYSQPGVYAGRLYTGSDLGYVYSLDAATGCIYWSFRADGQVRNAPLVGPVQGHAGATHAVFFGDAEANVYALDARTGALLWRERIDNHFTARITGSLTLHEGRLYIPVSSSEAFAGGTPDYPCCTFRGSVVALDVDDGQRIWKTYTIAETPKPYKKNEKGVQLYAPAGVSVWGTPAVDPVRRAIYVGTGDSWTAPAVDTSDAVMALDMDTGVVRWVFQGTREDVWLGGCFGEKKSAACPPEMGPDNDFGAAPILQTLSDGRRLLIVAQKFRNVFALDPDKDGAVVWQGQVSPSERGGVFWGGAAVNGRVYYGVSDGGVAAIELKDGARSWFNPITQGETRVSFTAATSAVPGAIFAGGSDGKLRSLSMENGDLIWEYDTARDFETVNGVAAHGGSLRSPGAVIANGMLFVGSGYGVLGASDKPGNVLLAFGVE